MPAANPIVEDVLVHELAITVIGHDRPGIIAIGSRVLRRSTRARFYR